MKGWKERADQIVDRELASVESYEGNALRELRRLWVDFLRPYRVQLTIALVLTLLIALHTPVFVLTWRFLVDRALCVTDGIPEGMTEHHRSLIWMWVGMNTTIWTLLLLSNWLRTYLVQTTGQKLTYLLRRRLHEKLQLLHIGFYESTSTGRLMSRVMGDVNVVHEWATNQAINLITQLFTLVAGLAVLLYLHAGLAAIMIITLPLYGYAFGRVRPTIRRFNVALRRMNSGLYGRAAERISGIQVVQAFGRERAESRHFAQRVGDMIRAQMRLVGQQQILTLVSTTLSAITTAVIIYLAITMVHHETMTLGSTLAFLQTLPPVFWAVNHLTQMIAEVQGPLVCLQRMFRLLDEQEDLPTGGIRLEGMVGRISLDDVSFTYPSQAQPALSEVSFQVAPGERVAIMGPSGSGKSTIFQLLLRFYDPQGGAVRVGGVNLADAATESVRRHVCMVQQEPHVFSGTLAENIMYGHLDATPSEVIRAAQHTELHDFIMGLPLKYETEVGEHGVTLSGGQRQRLSLATALLTDPEVLLLDDTTSALDATTEAKIRDTLNRVSRERTSLVITQRVATARDADRILVMEKGVLTQDGTHDELSCQPGFYRTICQQQEGRSDAQES